MNYKPRTKGHLIEVLMGNGKIKKTDTVYAGFSSLLETELETANKSLEQKDVIINKLIDKLTGYTNVTKKDWLKWIESLNN
jgi:hypothetical protein